MIDSMLQDWLPYLLSFSLLYALSGLYTVQLSSYAITWVREKQPASLAVQPMPIVAVRIETARNRLVRRVKRKDAPDDDDTDCHDSLGEIKINQRGGTLCPLIKQPKAALPTNACSFTRCSQPAF